MSLNNQKKIISFLARNGYDLDRTDNLGHTALHYASQHGNLCAVTNLLESIFDLDADPATQTGFSSLIHEDIKLKKWIKRLSTSLHLACEHGHLDIVKYLLETLPYTEDYIDNKDSSGHTALHLACKHGHLEVIKYLLAQGSDPKGKNFSRQTALHLACQHGHLEIVTYFLETLPLTEDYIDNKDSSGHTALHLACKHGHLEVIKYLLAQGSDPKGKNFSQQTALHLACQHGHLEIVTYFLETLPLTEDYIDNKDHLSQTALHLACHEGHLKIVEQLLIHRSSIAHTDIYSFTPLHVAATQGHLAIIKLLINHGAHPQEKTLYGETALHLAAGYGHLDSVTYFLVDQKYDINTTTHTGETALHLAARSGHLEVVDTLLNRGCHINIKTHTGQTALHLAAQANRIKIVTYLLKKGADPRIQDHNNNTPLYLAMRKNADQVALALLDYGINETKTDEDGNTLLHLACLHLSENTIKKIIDLCHDVNTKNTSGYTALHIAVLRSLYTTVKDLLKKGADVNASLSPSSHSTPYSRFHPRQNAFVKLPLPLTFGVKFSLSLPPTLPLHATPLMLATNLQDETTITLLMAHKSHPLQETPLSPFKKAFFSKRFDREIQERLRLLFDSGYKLTDTDMNTIHCQFGDFSPQVQHIIWIHLNESQRRQCIKIGFENRTPPFFFISVNTRTMSPVNILGKTSLKIYVYRDLSIAYLH